MGASATPERLRGAFRPVRAAEKSSAIITAPGEKCGLAVALTVAAALAFGQELPDPPTQTAVFEVAPAPGHAVEFEAALERHMAWAQEQGSTWRWQVFEVTHGKRVGNYLLVSADRSWADFDANREFLAPVTPRWRAEVAQHVESVGGGIYSMLAGFTRAPEDDLDTYPLRGVSFFSMLPTSGRTFLPNLRKVTDALGTQPSAPPELWYQQVGGGEQGTFMSVRPFRKWVDWPNRGLARAMNQAMDPADSSAIVAELGKVILREETMVVVLRPDLGSP